MLKEFNFHEGPILAMKEANGSLFATGSDSRIISLQHIGNEWRHSSTERGQSHDIMTLEFINNDKDQQLISGGITTDICIYKIKDGRFIDRELKNDQQSRKTLKLRHINPFPQERICHFSKFNHLIMFQKSFQFEIWQFFSKIDDYRLILRYNTKGQHVISSSLSQQGKYFAYSNENQTYLFSLNIKDLHVQKIKEIQAAQKLLFISDNVLVYLDYNNKIFGYNISQNQTFAIDQLDKETYQCVDIAEVSPNQKSFIFGSKLTGSMMLYDISSEDIIHLEIPKLIENTTLVNVIFTIDGQQLFLQYSNRKFVFYNVKYHCLSKWSQKNTNRFPKNYLKTYNFPIGAVFHPRNLKEIILYTNYELTKISYQIQPPKDQKWIENKDPNTLNFLNHQKKSKNQKYQITSFVNMKLNNPVLHMEVLDEQNIVAIEVDWQQILKQFPMALNTKKFGF